MAQHAGGGSSIALTKPVGYWTARNTLLLLSKHWPARWLPLVLYRQLSWLDAAARRGRLGIHLRGLLAGLALVPAGLRERGAWRTKPVSIEDAVPRRPWRGRRAGGHPRSRVLMRWALLALATLVLCGVTILWQVEPHDEGLMLAWAGRIASGAGALPRLLVQLRARDSRCCWRGW